VFPEGALAGTLDCSCRFDGHACASHRELAERVPGPSSEHVAALARELDLYVVFGLTEREPDDPSVLYNAAAVAGVIAGPAFRASARSTSKQEIPKSS
jgi:hypothetical protein